MSRRIRYRVSWPTVSALALVLAALVAVVYAAPAEQRVELLGAIGAGGSMLLAVLRPLIAARVVPLLIAGVMSAALSACGASAGAAKPLASICGAARLACALVTTSCDAAASVATAGGEQ